MRFRDRIEAGRALAGRLGGYAGRPDVVVIGLPRGGVPVAFEVARALGAPLDVLVVRKLGLPGEEELAMGAVAGGGVRVLNADVVEALGVPTHVIDAVAAAELEELERRERLYRDDRPALEVRGRTAILVDDGVATGSTVRAGVLALRRRGAARVVVAAPVSARDARARLAEEADEVVVLAAPEPFYAVGLWYEDLTPTSHEEVRELLERARAAPPPEAPAPGP